MFISKKKLQQKVSLLPIDFKKPWWHLIFVQRGLASLILFLIGLTHAFWFITPFLIAKMFESHSIPLCILFFIVWIIIDCGHAFARQLNAIFQLQCIHSIYHNAHQHLLTIDPRYHVHRSSGAILGKIDRGARGYEDLLDQLTLEFLPILMGIVVMIIALSWHSLLLAAVICLFFVLMLVTGYYFAKYACIKWEQGFINSDDDFRSTAVENLAQVQMVRQSFASDSMSDKLTTKVETNMKTEGSLWLSYIATSFTLNMVYLGSIFIILGTLYYQINNGLTTITAALGLAVAYIQSTKGLMSITKQFRRYMRGWVAVTDLFDFMAYFGKQTFPVLGEAESVVSETDTISVEANEISFNYETAVLFNNHTFKLAVPTTQRNKLFGIIGKSGSGKTTLLSILGGQLKPNSGSTIVNSTDIYAVNDVTRRNLIALQGQTATNVKGTVKYNMLFGLPSNHGISDNELLEVLTRVGLRGILDAHQELKTMLGEGGLNLSGGQRQRLNFASLYLRARYYKPALILIDEPTSSLDEISEASITTMIEELALSSVTLVIAHRLKTIEKAAGLIDLSLLKSSESITAHSSEYLEKHSHYYQQLKQGKTHLDS